MYRGRILAIMDSATAPTGFGNQADKVLSRLVERGWEVYQFAANCWDIEKLAELREDGYYHYKGINLIKNTELGTRPDGGVYPSKEIIAKLYSELKPDVVFTLNDFYRVNEYLNISEDFTNHWVNWFPVDHPEVNRQMAPEIDRFNYLVFLSSFGYKDVVPYIPHVKYVDAIYHAVPSNTFYPLPDKEELKRKHGFQGKFVILTVGRHQPRKMIYHTAEAVGRFLEKHPDAMWLVKADPNDTSMFREPAEERDLNFIMDKHSVSDRVFFETKHLPDDQMNELYNCGDIFIHMSGGEGFGIPYVESMLAGVPCILNDNTTSPELTGGWSFGMPVPVSSRKFVPMFQVEFDIGNLDIAVERLEEAYKEWKDGGEGLVNAGLAAREFHMKWCDAEKVVDRWEEVFQRIIRGNNPVLWHSHFGRGVGFTTVSEAIVPALEELGYEMYINDWMSGGSTILEPHFRELYEKYLKVRLTKDFYDCPQVICWLMEVFNSIDGNYKIGWSLVESTKLRAFYQKMCNGMDYIVTSTDFNRNVQKKSGIICPIHIVPPCIDTARFPEQERPVTIAYARSIGKDEWKESTSKLDIDKPFTFLHIGVLQERKNTEQIVDGYVTAFPNDGKTRLVVKSNDFGRFDEFSKKYRGRTDIEWVYTAQDPLPQDQLLKLYRLADCYVNLSHGEGIGMPDLEALATGLPVIGSNWDSRGAFLDDEVGWMVKIAYMDKAYVQSVPEDCGEWAHFDGQDYMDKMKYAASHPEECREKGKKGAERVRTKFTAMNAAKALDELFMDIYKKKMTQRDEEMFGENYYTNIHKYNPEWHDAVSRYIIQFCDGMKGKTLDIGCGRGYMMSHLLKHGIDIQGIEISKYAVEHPLPNCVDKIQLADASKMPFKDREFQWGMGFSLMEHIPERYVDDVLKEISRVCENIYLEIAIVLEPGMEEEIKAQDPTHITVHPLEWWEERFYRAGLKVVKQDRMHLILKHIDYTSKPVKEGDRMLVGIPTKDRIASLNRTFESLLKQTVNNFDVIVIDDSVVDHVNEDTDLSDKVKALYQKGVGSYLVRGPALNQAAAHNMILKHGLANNYKMVFRCDDDVTLEPNHLELLFKEFLKDEKCEYAAMGGIILNPFFPLESQHVPDDWGTRKDYAGTLDPCLFNAQVNIYPEEIEYRDDIQHLYSSYMYRPELLASVGGFPAGLSAIGFREETIGLYELYLQGKKLRIVTKAFAFHYCEQTGGLRAQSKQETAKLYGHDEGLFRKKVELLLDKYGKR